MYAPQELVGTTRDARFTRNNNFKNQTHFPAPSALKTNKTKQTKKKGNNFNFLFFTIFSFVKTFV